jgi:hypothetical protein
MRGKPLRCLLFLWWGACRPLRDPKDSVMLQLHNESQGNAALQQGHG